jgi:phospholipid/cholesterol/gamma-HCH transport system permease protein
MSTTEAKSRGKVRRKRAANAESEGGSAAMGKFASRAGSRPEPDEDERYIPGAELLSRLVDSVRSVGEQTAFIGTALAGTVDAVRRYPGEVLRLIAVLGMGTGALAVIGGTVVIIGFLTLTTGALIAVQGYNTLSNVGIEALTGFLGAFLNVRFIAPATAGVALAATIGAGATAQLGAMRINEEIDALESMALRPKT